MERSEKQPFFCLSFPAASSLYFNFLLYNVPYYTCIILIRLPAEKKHSIPKKIKAIRSVCAVGRDENGKIILKDCPFFKSSAVNAAKYLRYKPPSDDMGLSCEIKDTTFEYKFSLYNVKLDYDDFIIRDDYANRDSDFSETMTNYSINQINLTGENPPLTQKAAAIENAKP